MRKQKKGRKKRGRKNVERKNKIIINKRNYGLIMVFLFFLSSICICGQKDVQGTITPVRKKVNAKKSITS